MISGETGSVGANHRNSGYLLSGERREQPPEKRRIGGRGPKPSRGALTHLDLRPLDLGVEPVVRGEGDDQERRGYDPGDRGQRQGYG